MEARTGSSAVGSPPTAAGPLTNGRSEAIAAPPRRRSRRMVLIPIVLVVVALVAYFSDRFSTSGSGVSRVSTLHITGVTPGTGRVVATGVGSVDEFNIARAEFSSDDRAIAFVIGDSLRAAAAH